MFLLFLLCYDLKNKFGYDFMNFKNVSFELMFFLDWKIWL